jgi:hypothetical protein
MTKRLMAVVLGLAALAAAQMSSQQPGTPSTPAQPATPQAQAQGPVIKDPAEYNAYVSAVQQQDPAAKISGLEAFLVQYPNSVVKKDALEVLMGAYQQTNNQAKMTETAKKLLGVMPATCVRLRCSPTPPASALRAVRTRRTTWQPPSNTGRKGWNVFLTSASPKAHRMPTSRN